MQIVLVFGKKVLNDGSLSRKYQAQLQKAVGLLRFGIGDRLVITGGVTRAGFPSEAEVAIYEIPNEYRDRVILEKESKSTSENIRYVRGLLSAYPIERLIVITSHAHEPRVRFLLGRLWPEVAHKVEFDGVQSSVVDWVVNGIIYLLMRLDPNDRIFLPIQKLCYKNG